MFENLKQHDLDALIAIDDEVAFSKGTYSELDLLGCLQTAQEACHSQGRDLKISFSDIQIIASGLIASQRIVANALGRDQLLRMGKVTP